MKKSDLKTGMVVELRNGKKFMVIKDNLVNCKGHILLKGYDDDLTLCTGNLNCAIIKVYDTDKVYQLCEKNWNEMPCIWEREQEVDWSKIPVDTKVLVKEHIEDRWLPRYFAKYENGKVYTWKYGQTSWSSAKTSWSGADVGSWRYAKLYACEDESEGE